MTDVKQTTVGILRAAGFIILEMPEGDCECGHPSDSHVLTAALGSPVDGGFMACQLYPTGCSHISTWDTTMPEEQKDKWRDRHG
jgi:hypothetical protein